VQGSEGGPPPGRGKSLAAEETTSIVDTRDATASQRPPAKDRHLLIRVQGSHVGQVIALSGKPLRLGRRQDCEIWLNEPGVSRVHARICPDIGGYVVEDLQSSNGTFVNSRAVRRQRLNDGDTVQFGPLVAYRYTLTDVDQEKMLKQLYSAIVTDPLTGAYNREHFDHRLAAELSYARRHNSQVSLVLFDVDHFKLINDTHGHPAGDRVLVQVAKAALGMLRAEDVFARYGGEEFAVILRNIDLEGARRVGERLRLNIARIRVESDTQDIAVTISAGCSALTCCDDPPTPEKMVAIADRRLYSAKRTGRNKVTAEG
jgi:diguanylate cyclase (GGDEF)-like protein